MSIATYLTALDRDRDALAANLVAKGVQATSSETFTSLVPKVLNIPAGGAGEVEWNTTTVNITAPQTTTNANLTNIGFGIKKLTIEDLTLKSNSEANGIKALLGFPNIEELTFKNCKFGANDLNYGPVISNSSNDCALLNKITLKDCIIGLGASQSYLPLKFEIIGIDTDIIVDGLIIETGRTMIDSLFKSCNKIKTISFNNITLNNCTVFTSMFNACSSLTSIDLSSFVVNPTRVYRMFYGCTSLTTIDISGFDCTGITSSTNYSDMFYNVPTNCTIYVKDAANQAWFSSKFSSWTFTIKP